MAVGYWLGSLLITSQHRFFGMSACQSQWKRKEGRLCLLRENKWGTTHNLYPTVNVQALLEVSSPDLCVWTRPSWTSGRVLASSPAGCTSPTPSRTCGRPCWCLRVGRRRWWKAAGSGQRLAFTLSQNIYMRDNFHLNFICRWLCVFTRSETALTRNLFNGIMPTTNATDLAKKCLEPRAPLYG